MNLYTRIQAILNALDEDDGIMPNNQHSHILMCLSCALQQMSYNKRHEDIDLARTLTSVEISTDWVTKAENSLREAGL